MITKHFLPESFDFGMPSVELIGVGSKGLDKQAMVKRATAFDDILADIKPKDNRTYLHVITTGAGEYYGPNMNGDYWPECSHDVVFTDPESSSRTHEITKGGLKEYHDKTYMSDDAAVYQEHQTKRAGVDPSGEIVAAKYNDAMHRGELLIAVDTSKWASRLQKKAQGKNIYLSIGASVPRDLCFPKGTLVLTPYGYTQIEKIEVGDAVVDGEGQVQTVVATSVANTASKTSISLHGLPLPLESTPNHPYLCLPVDRLYACQGSVRDTSGGKVKRRHTLDNNGVCTTCGKRIDLTPVWKRADELCERDFLISRLDEHSPEDTVGVKFAYLCGQYIGDGCLLHAKNGHDKTGEAVETGISIAASGATSDAGIVEKILECVHAVTGKDAKVRRYGVKNAYAIEVFDKSLAARIHEYCGAGSRGKVLSAEIASWSLAEKLALIAGYMDSDGSVDGRKRYARIVTVNRGLAIGLLRMAWSVGLKASAFLGNSAKSMERCAVFGSKGPAYAVGISNPYALLKDYSVKVAKCAELAEGAWRTRSSLLVCGNNAYIPVYSVRTYECEPVAVYNFEVTNSHTYNAEGVTVHNCPICGRSAKTASQHCDHFTKMRGQVLDNGQRCYVINDEPSFYDISGVDVPADRIAFVLRKVASGETTKQASLEAMEHFGSRPAPLYTKAAAIAGKLARMEKIVAGIDDDLPEASEQSDDTEKDFLSRVENYPTDEVIDSCNRKGMLLTPGMLFKLLGRDCEDLDARKLFSECDDDCCGDCSTLMEELDEDEDKNSVLMDGTFDDILPVDLGLDSILERFMPELGMTQPAVNGRVIRITITQMSPRKRQEKRASFTKSAQKALRDTYARYLISFASRNDDATCYNALRKCARFGNCAALS